MEKDYITPSEYADRMSMTIRTVYRYYHKGKIEGIQDRETGTIRLKNPFKKEKENILNNRAILYARVSSSQNKKNLDSQLSRLKSYSIANGYQIVSEIKEVGSGLNDNRAKLNKILEKEDWDILVVEHKDRLTRFGFNYLDTLLAKLNRKVEVINLVDSDKEDLIQDFVSIITSFCSRIYGNRICKRKTEKIIEVLENERKKSY